MALSLVGLEAVPCLLVWVVMQAELLAGGEPFGGVPDASGARVAPDAPIESDSTVGPVIDSQTPPRGYPRILSRLREWSHACDRGVG
jgi:hypothetical protein